METSNALSALAALAQETRLSVFRLLVPKGPAGMSAGAIASELAVSPPVLSFHLQHLTRAGLVSQRRLGRQIHYAADYGAMNGLVRYLSENCCGVAGGVTVCDPAIFVEAGSDQPATCCKPGEACPPSR